MTTKQIDNGQDVIDSRDIIARIEELQANLEAAKEAGDSADLAQAAEDAAELTALLALQSEAEGYADDWHYGVGLIRDSYFTRYAQELADDIGAIDRPATWPCNHIDWEAAADALKQDYTSVEFDGVTYWVR